MTDCIGFERISTDGRVRVTGGVVHERVIAKDRVADAVAALLTIRSRLRCKRKAGEREWNEQQSERASRAVRRMF